MKNGADRWNLQLLAHFDTMDSEAFQKKKKKEKKNLHRGFDFM